MASPSYHPAPLGFRDGQLETLKWLAMASMFCDHIGRHLLGMPQEEWPFQAGRLAFPLFAFVLGTNLAREGDRAARSGRTALRLLGWGALSVLPSIWARGDPEVINVLVTLACGAALCWAVDSQGRTALRVFVVVAVAAASWFVEFGIGGAFLVVACYLYASRRGGGLAAMALLLLAATGWLNAHFGGWTAFFATLAALPLAWAVRHLPVAMPRWQLLFYAIYPVHLALIGALKHQWL